MHDTTFRTRFEAGEIPPSEFGHRAHLRLAWVFLQAHEPDEAHREMARALQRFLAHHGVDPGHYHETMTRAWIDAVARFRRRIPAPDFATFIGCCPELLDASIMLTHYSEDRLMSAEARASYVEPDIQAIG